jgi:hypothetical protein
MSTNFLPNICKKPLNREAEDGGCGMDTCLEKLLSLHGEKKLESEVSSSLFTTGEGQAHFKQEVSTEDQATSAKLESKGNESLPENKCKVLEVS